MIITGTTLTGVISVFADRAFQLKDNRIMVEARDCRGYRLMTVELKHKEMRELLEHLANELKKEAA